MSLQRQGEAISKENTAGQPNKGKGRQYQENQDLNAKYRYDFGFGVFEEVKFSQFRPPRAVTLRYNRRNVRHKDSGLSFMAGETFKSKVVLD